MLRTIWNRIWEFVVSRRELIIVACASVVVGLAIAATYLTVVDKTSTMAFCANACHEMQATVYKEYEHTAHFKNAQGFVVTCADCHIPKNSWVATMVAKMTDGPSDVWHHVVDRDYILENFNRKRPELEKDVLAEFAATNARACKSCHHWNNMILSAQNEAARAMHSQAMKTDANCLDCHKGIAHADVLGGATAPAAYMLTDTTQAAQGSMQVAQSGGANGQAIYAKGCAACHGNMEPKLGDKAAWAPLLKQGEATLVAGTIHGKGIMPARGGNSALSDQEIKAAVDYMISKAQ